MSLKLDYSQSRNAEEAYQRVKSNITPETIARYQVSADLQYIDEQKRILADGSGFNLSMEFFETYAEVRLDLSFLLKPLKGKILSGLERQLTRLV